jgi:hypothetical protein
VFWQTLPPHDRVGYVVGRIVLGPVTDGSVPPEADGVSQPGEEEQGDRPV